MLLQLSDRIDSKAAERVNKSGGQMTGDLSMGRNNITQLADPVRQNDAVNKSYVDDKIRSFSTSEFVNKNGDQMMGDLNMNGQLFTWFTSGVYTSL